MECFGQSANTLASLRGVWFIWMIAVFGCDGPIEPIDYSGPLAEWRHYGSGIGGGRFSPADQIRPSNVDRLEVAWTYHTGDLVLNSEKGYGSSFQNTPIVVGDTLYGCTPLNRIFALNAETGEERWTHDPRADFESSILKICRGVSYWRDEALDSNQECGERILMGTLDARMIAVDANTGIPCSGFGEGGEIDLADGIGDRIPGEYGVTSPPLIMGDILVTGTMVLDNIRVDAPGGVVRAYDVRNGELVWSWDPLPPGRDFIETAGPDGEMRRYHRGTTNAWSILSGDEALGLVFVPTGNTTPDYFGAGRDGLDYYSSSVVALDAKTGQPAWHFQTVHHDVWDYDVPAQPGLFEFPGESGAVPSLAQATKLGHIFLLNRLTGEPLFPVEERPVSQDGVPGEIFSPTQPFPTLPEPIHPTTLLPEDAFGITPWDRADCRRKIEALRYEGLFTPPEVSGWLGYPGYFGGTNWGSVAIDPVRNLLITNTSRMASRLRLIPRAEYDSRMAQEGPEARVLESWEPQQGTPYALTRGFLVSEIGLPCSPPPWGTLVAIDLATAELRWEIPLGTTADLAPFGLALPLGVPNQGGPIVTGSGLVFISATMDDYLRAFEIETGEELWRARLPAGGQATPLTYRVSPDGKQYVVIAAGGHALMGTTPGDAVVAFALPDE